MNVLHLFFFALFMTSSCKGLFTRQDTDLKIVRFNGTTHKPYCGGAKPSPDMAAGYYEPMTGQAYNVFQGTEYSDDAAIVKELTFDQEGNCALKLPQGHYYLMHADKRLSRDQFLQKYGSAPNQNYKVKEASCFDEWRKKVDLYFGVSNDTLIELRQKAKCWVGTNPCLEYVGPPAP